MSVETCPDCHGPVQHFSWDQTPLFDGPGCVTEHVTLDRCISCGWQARHRDSQRAVA